MSWLGGCTWDPRGGLGIQNDLGTWAKIEVVSRVLREFRSVYSSGSCV